MRDNRQSYICEWHRMVDLLVTPAIKKSGWCQSPLITKQTWANASFCPSTQRNSYVSNTALPKLQICHRS